MERKAKGAIVRGNPNDVAVAATRRPRGDERSDSASSAVGRRSMHRSGVCIHVAEQSSNPRDSTRRDDVLRIMCPKLGCQRILAVPTAARGKLVRCRNCGTNIKIPMEKVAEAPPKDRAKPEAA